MYDEIVKRLREVADEVDNDYDVDPYNAEQRCLAILQAADAIEELSMKLHGDEAAIAGMKREIERMVVYGNKPKGEMSMRCEYCHEDRDGYVVPFDKNAHVFWEYPDKLIVRIGKERRECKINYCPFCGRELKK